MTFFLDRRAVDLFHADQLQEHGGRPGLKDDHALEAALARPLHKITYSEPSIFDLAAAYLHGIVRNHPYVDGNKRTGFIAAFTFLYINGYLIDAEQSEVVSFVL